MHLYPNMQICMWCVSCAQDDVPRTIQHQWQKYVQWLCSRFCMWCAQLEWLWTNKDGPLFQDECLTFVSHPLPHRKTHRQLQMLLDRCLPHTVQQKCCGAPNEWCELLILYSKSINDLMTCCRQWWLFKDFCYSVKERDVTTWRMTCMYESWCGMQHFHLLLFPMLLVFFVFWTLEKNVIAVLKNFQRHPQVSRRGELVVQRRTLRGVRVRAAGCWHSDCLCSWLPLGGLWSHLLPGQDFTGSVWQGWVRGPHTVRSARQMLLVPKESFQHHRAHGDGLIMKEFGFLLQLRVYRIFVMLFDFSNYDCAFNLAASL